MKKSKKYYLLRSHNMLVFLFLTLAISIALNLSLGLYAVRLYRQVHQDGLSRLERECAVL